MAKIFKQSESVNVFMCPGCNEPHGITATLGFNGDNSAPTVARPIQFQGKELCDSIVIGGKITFAPGCSHELAGKTRTIPDWPYVDAYGTLPDSYDGEEDLG